jgi:epoxyqueuosine reductase
MTSPDKETIRAFAQSLGFDAVRFTRAETRGETRQHLAEFLSQGLHGDMGWLEANADRRADPKVLWPDAKTVVMVGLNYGPATDPRQSLGQPDAATVSIYARNRDYHDVLKKRLKRFATWLAAWGEVKIFVDTAPVLEKPLAQQAGLGWQGKHTNLVSRDFGSWLFLGELFTTLDIAPDEPETDHCGECRRCLDICPTQAFTAPYKLDARRCISYLTIEHKGVIPKDLRPAMGNRIYGCDDCLAVCPWNKFARMTQEADFLPRPQLTAPKLKEFIALDDAAFRALFAGSPVKRIGRARFTRNVLIAAGNSADASFIPAVEKLLRDEAPLVRGAAAWAYQRLASEGDIKKRRDECLALESKSDVREEWMAGASCPGQAALSPDGLPPN